MILAQDDGGCTVVETLVSNALLTSLNVFFEFMHSDKRRMACVV